MECHWDKYSKWAEFKVFVVYYGYDTVVLNGTLFQTGRKVLNMTWKENT